MMQCEYYPTEDYRKRCEQNAEFCLVWPRIMHEDDDLTGMRVALCVCGSCRLVHHGKDDWQLEFEL